MAPSISPPDRIWYRGLPPSSQVMTKTVPMYTTGTMGEITRRMTRYTPPSSRANTQVSPRQPPRIPTKSCKGEKADGSPPWDISASGVAEEIASAPCHCIGATQLFISPGKLPIRTIRPSRAGLTKFWPSPPNICLATTMATTLPRAACQRGMVEGRL